MIPSIFKDPVLQQQFDRDGYVKLPLLTVEEITLLTDIFHSFHPTILNDQFVSSSFMNDPLIKIKIKETIQPIFQPHLDRIFQHYSYFGSAFLYKSMGKHTDVAPHQDWTIVDEKKYVAINIWTPLIDTDNHNGTLCVVPGSHSSSLYTLRAPTIPFFFQHYFNTVIRCAVPVNIKAGEAIILNQSLIHYSAPNLSGKIRPAITSGLKTSGAPMLFHFMNKDKKVERYEMPGDFLLNFDNFPKEIYAAPTKGKLTEIIDYIPPALNRAEFMRRFSPTAVSMLDIMKEYLTNLFKR